MKKYAESSPELRCLDTFVEGIARYFAMTLNNHPTRFSLKTTELPAAKASTVVPKCTVKEGTGCSFSCTS